MLVLIRSLLSAIFSFGQFKPVNSGDAGNLKIPALQSHQYDGIAFPGA
jgi:hypothetical protein